MMTSKKHSTGTDRVAEAASNIKSDYYVNIQGDEPLIDPKQSSLLLMKLSTVQIHWCRPLTLMHH